MYRIMGRKISTHWTDRFNIELGISKWLKGPPPNFGFCFQYKKCLLLTNKQRIWAEIKSELCIRWEEKGPFVTFGTTKVTRPGINFQSGSRGENYSKLSSKDFPSVIRLKIFLRRLKAKNMKRIKFGQMEGMWRGRGRWEGRYLRQQTTQLIRFPPQPLTTPLPLLLPLLTPSSSPKSSPRCSLFPLSVQQFWAPFVVFLPGWLDWYRLGSAVPTLRCCCSSLICLQGALHRLFRISLRLLHFQWQPELLLQMRFSWQKCL